MANQGRHCLSCRLFTGIETYAALGGDGTNWRVTRRNQVHILRLGSWAAYSDEDEFGLSVLPELNNGTVSTPTLSGPAPCSGELLGRNLVEARMAKTARRRAERIRISWCYLGTLSVYRDMNHVRHERIGVSVTASLSEGPRSSGTKQPCLRRS